ncbi:MAG: deoxyguanosinetriphosphate triphosphohydrolase, partial [Pseudomonadota bacterium]
SLEKHYAEWDGLNLTWEALEGIAKHNGPVSGDLPYALADYNALHDLELHTHASAEAQVAALSDDVAYNNHDLMDGLRAGLFTEEDLMELPILSACFGEVDARYPDLERKRRRHEALRRVFGVMVEDLIATSEALLNASGAGSAQDIRELNYPVILFSADLFAQLKEIRQFLFARMYRAPSVMEKRAEATQIVSDLFPYFMAAPEHLPESWQPQINAAKDDTTLARLVADYIAGMTDLYAAEAHDRLLA